MKITDTLMSNAVPIIAVVGGYFLFFRDRDTGPTAEASGPGGTARYIGVIR